MEAKEGKPIFPKDNDLKYKKSKEREDNKKEDDEVKEEEEKDREKKKGYKSKEGDKKERKAKCNQNDPKEIKSKNQFQNKEKELFRREKKVIKKELKVIKRERDILKKEEELSKREEVIQKKEEELKREKEAFQKEKELLKREKEAIQKEKNNAIGIIESEIKQCGKDGIIKTKKSAQTHEKKKEQNDDIRNQDKEKELSDIDTKNEMKSNDCKAQENTYQEGIIDSKTGPTTAKSFEEKKMTKNIIALDIRKNENIVNISEPSLGENMHNYISTKTKEIVDVEKYEEGNKEELNVCYLDVNKNNVINEEKEEYLAQNIIDDGNLNYGNSNEIERNNEKAIKIGDGHVFLNEEKRNSVIKNVGEGEGKDNIKEINKK
jgi:hypothetical protein